jgi:osmotically-inducible protein OsmY
MIQSASLPSLSPIEHAAEEKDACLETVRQPAPSREDLGLAERVERDLRATGYGSLRAVEATVSGRLVILTGRVPSYYMKQLAQTIAIKVAGVHELLNQVQVVS